MKKSILTTVFASLFLLCFISATAQETAGVVPVKATVNDPVSTDAPERPLTEIYRVGIGDVLDIRLLNSSNSKSTLFTVVSGGIIDIPLAGGAISVGGLTAEEIQSRISTELKRRAVEENAQVSVGVRQYLSHSVMVTVS
ncbi:MAG TPA: polysaccharide biosynthesis/export family protein [Pyrinomonadaceae bacterium]